MFSATFLIGSGVHLLSQTPVPPPPQQTAALETVSLDQAIHRAEANEPAFAAATAESRALLLERTNARAALLPTASYHNQYIYTQPNGQFNRIGQNSGAPTPIFIANNSIHEYASQGLFNETLGFQQVGAIRLADANAARAAAEAEIARRGLVLTVVGLYHGLNAQQAKLHVAERARDEAEHFVKLSQQREAGREVAHADVIKAQLQQQQRSRELDDARLALSRAQLELAVLLYPDPSRPFQIDADPVPSDLPAEAEVEALARQNSPELRSALASLQAADAETYNARAALLPDIGLNATYGIDAPQFAVNGPVGVRNLGYAASVLLDIPVWDWLTTERRIKQSRIRRDAVQVALTAAQRRQLANLREFYAEAAVARQQLASLAQSVDSAGESLRLTNLRYADGESTALEVVDAQTTLVTAQLAQTDGDTRYRLALAQLQTLTGRLLP